MLTREEAEQIVKEALEQGWEGDRQMESYENADGSKGEYNLGNGRVDLMDFGTPPGVPGPGGNSGCAVQLKWPGALGPKYWIRSRDEWRQLKAKVEEMREIIAQMRERDWQIPPFSRLQKVGKFGMMIEAVPPGGSAVYPVRVGGMRTWRKLCRDYDEAIDMTPRPALEEARD